MITRSLLIRAAFGALFAVLSTAPTQLKSQAPSQRATLKGGDGFLFGRPNVTLALRGGFARPDASSDIFAFASQHLTIGRHAYGGAAIGAEFGIRMANRLDFQMSGMYSGRILNSHFRDWVDNNDNEIEQSTSFRRMPLTIGFKYHLTNPGRSISNLAWVPARFTPYVGAGVGRIWYTFRQTGDFFDFQTLDVFHTTMKSSTWSSVIYGSVGGEYTLTPHLGLITEARYDRARADMGSDFVDFQHIDLSGLTASVGFTLRY